MTLVSPLPSGLVAEVWAWLHERPDANFDDSGPRTLAAFDAYMQQRIADEWTWAAFIQDEPAGAFGVKRISPDRAQWNGVCVREKFHGRGVASQAIRLICAELQAVGVVAVDAFMFADNGPIRRVFERSGARQQPCAHVTRRHGVPVDVVRYEMQVGG